MSLQRMGIGEIPAETVRVARAVCPRGTLAMRMRDEFGQVFSGAGLASLYSDRGRPVIPPGLLALVTVLQFAEGLPDRQAAEAVRTRIDWKYALGLELTDPGFDFTVLCDFRARLADSAQAAEVFDRVLAAAQERGLLRTTGRARTDSTRVLAAVRAMSWLERLGETLRAALNALAQAAPEWLAAQVSLEWFDRYGHRVEESRMAKTKTGRLAWAAQAGADGMRLLQAVFAPTAPPGLARLPAVELLRGTWVQSFKTVDGTVRLREANERPPSADCPGSPYDPEATFGNKRDIQWTGYLLHATETCEPDAPNLITHVATTAAAFAETAMVELIHADLAAQQRLPATHLVDAGYVDAANLLAARSRGIELLGPTRPDTSRKPAGYRTDAFAIDWDTQTVTCPNGKTNVVWRNKDHKHHGGRVPVVVVRFAARDCAACPQREPCTTSYTGRSLMLRPREEHQALQQVRAKSRTEQWKQRYDLRAGIEATIAQGVRAFGLRHCRYHGHAKTSLQHLFTASAMNLTRLDAWITGIPRAGTRTSHFAALRPAT